MESSSSTTSDRGRVTLVMATVPVLLVTEVVVFLLWKVFPALLVTEGNTTSTTSRAGTNYHHKINTTSLTSRVGTTYHHKSNANSATSRAGTVTITRVTRPLPLVEQELLLTITRVTRPLSL
jgi:hypothetical protein